MENEIENVEQQLNLLNKTMPRKRSKSKDQRSQTVSHVVTQHLRAILLLFAVVATGIIAIIYIPQLMNKNDENIVLKQGKFFGRNPYQRGGSNDDYGLNRNRNKKMQSFLRRHGPSEAIGRVILFFNQPTDNGNRRTLRRVHIPAIRYDRRRFSLGENFTKYMLSTPIFAHRFTKEIIIYSLRSVYILPSLIDADDKQYSIASLVASGHISLVDPRIRSTSSSDMTNYFRSTPITGPGIPDIDMEMGGFSDGMHTNIGSFGTDDEDEYENEYRKPSRGKNKYDPTRTRHT
ncbi:unnamed protein product, partial [Adineta ricciae]